MSKHVIRLDVFLENLINSQSFDITDYILAVDIDTRQLDKIRTNNRGIHFVYINNGSNEALLLLNIY